MRSTTLPLLLSVALGLALCECAAALVVHDDAGSLADRVRVERVSFENRRGVRVNALLLLPVAGEQHHAAILLQRDLSGRADDLMPDARLLAEAGAIALLPDWSLGGNGYPSDEAELWNFAAGDLASALDALTGRPDVDPQRLGFLGLGFGASAGAVLAATDTRVRAAVLVAPEGDVGSGSYSSLLYPPLSLQRFDALPASARFRGAKVRPPVLLQFGSSDGVISTEGLSVWLAGLTAQDEARWHVTSDAPEARRERFSFLAAQLRMRAPQ